MDSAAKEAECEMQMPRTLRSTHSLVPGIIIEAQPEAKIPSGRCRSHNPLSGAQIRSVCQGCVSLFSSIPKVCSVHCCRWRTFLPATSLIGPSPQTFYQALSAPMGRISERARKNSTSWAMLNKAIGWVEDCLDHCGPGRLLLSAGFCSRATMTLIFMRSFPWLAVSAPGQTERTLPSGPIDLRLSCARPELPRTAQDHSYPRAPRRSVSICPADTHSLRFWYSERCIPKGGH